MESGFENVKFEKCIFLSFLEDEYNSLYTKLITQSGLLNSILISYCNSKNLDVIEGLNEKEKEILLEGIRTKYIDVDYIYYFFKFPKNKKAYNIYELDLYNAIFFNNLNSQLNVSVENLSEEEIEKIIKKRDDLSILPSVIFENKKLLTIAYNKEQAIFMNTIEKKYDLINNFKQFSKLKVKLEKVDKYIYYEIMKKYFERKYNDIDALDKGQKNELRLKLVKLFKDKVTFFKEMFLNENDLVTIEEMRNINDLTIIYEITNENKINDVYIKECMKYNKYNLKSFIIKFLKNMSNNKSIKNNEWYKLIYESINYQKYNFTEQERKRLFNISKVKLGLDNLENFRKYILKTNYYANFLDVHYISLIDSNASEQIKDYIYL